MRVLPIRQIRNTALLTAGLLSCVACEKIDFSQKAKEKVIPYMNGTELVAAEKYAKLQPNYSDALWSVRVNYWDSLILEKSVNKAYTDGRQMVKDSLAGKPYTNNYENVKLDTIIHTGDVYKLDEQFAQYANANELMDCRNAEPEVSTFYNGGNGRFYTAHYWNVLYQQYKQREAFEQGAADERAENIAKISE